MKKILLLFFMIACCLGTISAQTLTTTATTISSGGTVIIKGSGESSAKYFEAEQGNDISSVTPSGYNGYESFHFTQATYYAPASNTPTTLTYTFTNTASIPVVVHFCIMVEPFDGTHHVSLPQETYCFDITVNPAPPPTYTSNITGTFTRNDCSTVGSNMIGSSVVYTPPPYTSTISQADANAQAQADINANGQAYANAHGTCTLADPLQYISITGPTTFYTQNTQFVTYQVVYTGVYASYPQDVGWLAMPTGWQVGTIIGSRIIINPSPNATVGSVLVKAQVYVNNQWYNLQLPVRVVQSGPIQP